MPLMVLGWLASTDGFGGQETVVWMQSLLKGVFVLSLAYVSRRILCDGANARELLNASAKHPVGAGLSFLGVCLLTGLLVLAWSGHVRAEDLPPGARMYGPVLKREMSAHWQGMPLPSALAAQVEQETCPSVKSSLCWNPRTELRTSREYGFGLGQITVTAKFNNFDAAKRLDRSLSDWRWDERFVPDRQLRALVLMNKQCFQRLRYVEDDYERLAMSFSCYNGGLGGVLADQRLCAARKGCAPGVWFGHVELTSRKGKTAVAGYGQSFFEINRSYVRNVMIARRGKYVALMEG
jgi:hypothetical protein